ncbi:hypothetical protein IGM_04353 [Bacillus cereus HuB4-4]|uniref:Terminase small subunit n=1 Tax=Bacillus cereus HuB4-4 TaxID=1053211 RepID=A0A9W5QS49_BACCE|nr:terminase small subunit [Bacillus cereus]EOP85978.1 hypothetical protein IGM_04353 [Bacillus cereus HuB4-4]
MRLTPKQQRFIEEYLVDLNATQAAIRAGYSQKTARKIGQENLTKPDIQTAIEEAMDERSKRAEITQDMVLEELAKIAFSDMKDFASWATETKSKLVKKDDEFEKIEWDEFVFRYKNSEQIDGAVVKKVGTNKDGETIELHDKLRALGMIGKHLGMFKEKKEISITVPTFVDDVPVDEDE